MKKRVMKNRGLSLIVGATLVLMGCGGLMLTSVLPLFGLNVWHWGMWRLWPSSVVCLGLLFVVPPLFVRRRRSMGALFIPGVPVLATGCLLFFASVFNAWDIWAHLWPVEVLAVAAGLVLAAAYMKVIWLVIPAIIIGLNGLVFQFCAATGLWGWWSVLWTIEPIAMGIALLVAAAATRSSGLFWAGIVVCALGGMAAMGMTLILSDSWLLNLLGPAAFILIGLLLLIWGMMGRIPLPRPAAE